MFSTFLQVIYFKSTIFLLSVNRGAAAFVQIIIALRIIGKAARTRPLPPSRVESLFSEKRFQADESVQGPQGHLHLPIGDGPCQLYKRHVDDLQVAFAMVYFVS